MEALNQQDKIKVVVNKDGISTVTVKNVANLLEATPVLVIPYDLKSAMLAVNRGVPMLSCAPNSKASKEIRTYARTMTRRV
jgi:Flp pilus assembly CpaE family ATPase